jgi:hypothetical protein
MEIIMGLEGFLWVRIMEHEISEHSTNLGCFCLAAKMPANNILYNILGFKRMKEEQGSLIQQKENRGYRKD